MCSGFVPDIEKKRLQHAPRDDLDTWGLIILAVAVQLVVPTSRHEKLTLLYRADELDPELATAHPCLAQGLLHIIIDLLTGNVDKYRGYCAR